MSLTYAKVKEVRGKCEDCGGSGRVPTLHHWDCPTCSGTGNGKVVWNEGVEVPEGYEFDEIYYSEILKQTIAVFRHNSLPLWVKGTFKKIGSTVKVVCDVCGGSWYYKCTICVYKGYCPQDVGLICTQTCPQCQGKPEASVTVTDISWDKETKTFKFEGREV